MVINVLRRSARLRLQSGMVELDSVSLVFRTEILTIRFLNKIGKPRYTSEFIIFKREETA